MNVDTARLAAAMLMHKHGLSGWSIMFDRKVRRAGACSHGRKLIVLSALYVEHATEEHVIDTILHEIAHALAGHGAEHGPRWVAQCLRIGAKPEQFCEPEMLPQGDWIAHCPCCNREFRKHRKPRTSRFCLRCGIDRGRLIFERVP